MNKLSVIIPARNEAENLTNCVSEICDELENRSINYEILVIDDGSTDNTSEIIQHLSTSYPAVKGINNSGDNGFGRAIRLGFQKYTGDAVAIMMALKNDNFDVKAITTVAGNVDLDQATTNAIYTSELCNKNIPVYRGESHPLKRKLETSKFFHGRDGLGDSGPYIPSRKAQDEDAVSKITSIINEYPNEIEIIAIGPLTNIAKVFTKVLGNDPVPLPLPIILGYS